MPTKITKTIKKAPKSDLKNGKKSKSKSGSFTQAHLANIIANIPDEWRGTTFKNSALLGRERFA